MSDSPAILFAVARIDEGGYIYVTDCGGPGIDRMWHRESRIGVAPHSHITLRDTIDEAKYGAAEGGIDHFVMQFEGDRCYSLWFTEEQENEGIVGRLERWKACYGGYKTNRLNPL